MRMENRAAGPVRMDGKGWMSRCFWARTEASVQSNLCGGWKKTKNKQNKLNFPAWANRWKVTLVSETGCKGRQAGLVGNEGQWWVAWFWTCYVRISIDFQVEKDNNHLKRRSGPQGKAFRDFDLRIITVHTKLMNEVTWASKLAQGEHTEWAGGKTGPNSVGCYDKVRKHDNWKRLMNSASRSSQVRVNSVGYGHKSQPTVGQDD